MAQKRLTSAYRYNNIEEKFSKNKPQKSCVELHYFPKKSSNKLDFLLQLWHWVLYFGPMFHKKRSAQQRQMSAYQDTQHGQRASLTKTKGLELPQLVNYSRIKNLILEALYDIRTKLSGFLYDIWQDRRLRWGLILLLVISPFTRSAYNLFPEDGFGEFIFESSYLTIPNFIESEEWLWLTIHFWVYGMSQVVTPLCAMFGIFLLFPKKYYPSYLVGIPFGYFLSLLIYKVTATATDDLFKGYGLAIVAMFIVLGVVVFIVSDKILFKKNHVIRSSEARMVGLINMPGMTWGDKEQLLKREANSWTKEQNELYDQSTEKITKKEEVAHMRAS